MALAPPDEAELLASRSVVNTVNAMLANKDARKLLLQARKITDPNASIPEIDAAVPVRAEVDEMKKLLEEDRKERQKERDEQAQALAMERANAAVGQQRERLRAQGWRDEGIAEIEKFAAEHGVPDLEIAASHWEKLHPPAEPATPNGSGSWNFFDDQTSENDKKFVETMINTKGEDEGALNAEIRAALTEVRGSQPARR
jgi:hypothetical protein